MKKVTSAILIMIILMFLSSCGVDKPESGPVSDSPGLDESLNNGDCGVDGVDPDDAPIAGDSLKDDGDLSSKDDKDLPLIKDEDSPSKDTGGKPETGGVAEPAVPPETGDTTNVNPYYIDLKLTPADAYDIFKDRYPAARVKEIELDLENNAYVYEVEGYEGSAEYEMKINPHNGKIIKIEEDDDNKTSEEIKREDLSRIPAILKKAVEAAAKEGYELKDWSIEIEGNIIEFEIEFTGSGGKIEHKYNLKTGELIKIKQK